MELIAGAKAAAALRGRGRTAFYSDVKAGVMTRPVRNGARSVAWPLHEIEKINAARIAGKGDDEIRALVVKLESARKTADQQPLLKGGA